MNVDVEVLSHQLEFMQASERFVCLTGGFGCGKSFGVGLKVWNLARINAGFDGMLVSRTATQLRKLMTEVETVLNLMGAKWKKKGFDEYHLDFGKKKNTIIYTGTTENKAYERWAGGNMAFVVIDEIDTMQEPEQVWRFANDRVRVRAPMLQTACASTPEGFGFLWSFFADQPTRDPSLAPRRRHIKGCTFDNPYCDPGYVRDQIETRDPASMRAYVYGEFVNLEGVLVYYRYDKVSNFTDKTLEHPMFDGCPVHVGLDFNKSINAATLNVVRDGLVYAVDEIYGSTNTDVLISSLNKRLGNREFFIYPDASGFEGIEQLKRAYGTERIKHPNKNPPIDKRVTAVNNRIASPSGMARAFVNPATCPRLHSGLMRQTKDSSGMPDKTKGLDHSLDGWGYFIWHHWPMTGTGTVSQLRLAA